MVETVADDGVLLVEQRLEQPGVGIEARAVEDGVIGSEEPGQIRLELGVDRLGAANEPHGGHSVPVILQRSGGCRQQRRMVGAEVEHLPAIGQCDPGVLRRGDAALIFEEPLLA